MDIGIQLPTIGFGSDASFVLEIAQAVDRLGYHSVWTSDHVALSANRSSVYPYQESTTELFMTAGLDWLDPIAVMGFVAGCTTRVRIGVGVLVVPYRNPVVLANMLASLDVLSNGRIILGAGVGWMDEEFQAVGVPRQERGARTDEALEVMRLLWRSSDPVSFDGRFSSFRDMVLCSHPVQAGGVVPVLIGGNSDGALRRAARLGEGWLGMEVFVDQVADVRSRLSTFCEVAERDPSSLTLAVRRGLLPPFEITNVLPERRCIAGSAEEVAGEVRAYAAAGVSLLQLDLAMVVPEVLATLDWFAAEVVPLL